MRQLDRGLLLVLFTLLGIGLVQVYSSSFIYAFESRGDGLFFIKKQALFAVMGFLILLATTHIPWRWFEKYGYGLWYVAALGVAATFVPSLGAKAGGAARWLDLPFGFVFEPSELLKVAFCFFIAHHISRESQEDGWSLWLLRVVSLSLPMALVLKQPDFGTFAICCLVGVAVLFACGLRWRYVLAGLLVALPTFYILVMNKPYRRARVLAFLDPWSDPTQKGFQVIQSMLSFQAGGLTGVGLGQGQGKLFFLPEAHTDFTLAVLGEEMGFVGLTLVLGLYAYLIIKGLRMAARANSYFARILAIGLTLTFALSVFINVGVALGLLPTKGLTLPFLSYGGSSLMLNCFLFGILLNLDRHERRPEKTVAHIFKRVGT